MSKILEKLIYCRLINHLDDNHIIHDNQFGFQKNKATYMPILLLQDTITRVFEEGEFALGLYLDIKKAFDTVNIRLGEHGQEQPSGTHSLSVQPVASAQPVC